MMMFDAVLSSFKLSSVVIKGWDDLPMFPKALIDKLTNVTRVSRHEIRYWRTNLCLFAITVDLYIGFKAYSQFNDVD